MTYVQLEYHLSCMSLDMRISGGKKGQLRCVNDILEPLCGKTSEHDLS